MPSASAPNSASSPILVPAGVIEKDLPLHSLDAAPWNAKKPIHGSYKRGLRGSLDYFQLRDRLKVWPRPDKRGRYYALDGNQRLPLLIEQAEDRILAQRFGLELDADFSNPDPKAVAKIRADPANAKELVSIRRAAMDAMVPCAIQRDLDAADARLFTLTFNRNHATYDEAKVALLSDEKYRLTRPALDRIVRPDRAFVQPLPRGADPATAPVMERAAQAQQQGQPVVSGDSSPSQAIAPTADEPWGPPPSLPSPVPSSSRPSSSPGLSLSAPNIPLMLSLTPEGYKEISNSTLRCASRIFREQTLKTALSQLDDACEDAPDGGVQIDDITREIALLTINRHIDARKVSRQKS